MENREDTSSIAAKNQELTVKCQTAEQARIKMLHSLTAVLTKVQSVLVISAEPPVKASSFFMTDGGSSQGGSDGASSSSASSSSSAASSSLTSTSLSIDEDLAAFFRTVNLADHSMCCQISFFQIFFFSKSCHVYLDHSHVVINLEFAAIFCLISLLFVLSIQLSDLGDDGAKLIGDALRISHNIHHLDLSRNHIRSDGLAHLIQCLVLDSCSVHNVDLSMNDINAEGVLALATALQRMHHVVRMCCQQYSIFFLSV